jgi:hypothetical protein
MGVFNNKIKYRELITPYLKRLKARLNLISLVRVNNKIIRFTDATNDVSDFDLSDVANDRQNDVTHIQYPQGGSRYSATETPVKGVFLIYLPLTLPNTGIHIQMDINCINGRADRSFKALIGGYLDTDGTWYDCTSRRITAINRNNRDVEYGIIDATNKAVIKIGDESKNWQDPAMIVQNVIAIYSNSSVVNLATGWNIEFVKQADYDDSLYTWTHGDTIN